MPFGHRRVERAQGRQHRAAPDGVGLGVQHAEPLGGRVDQILPRHLEQHQLAQVIHHLPPELARIGSAVDRVVDDVQAGCGIARDERIHQLDHILTAGRAQCTLGIV